MGLFLLHDKKLKMYLLFHNWAFQETLRIESQVFTWLGIHENKTQDFVEQHIVEWAKSDDKVIS